VWRNNSVREYFGDVQDYDMQIAVNNRGILRERQTDRAAK